jgi:hypothetical protein
MVKDDVVQESQRPTLSLDRESDPVDAFVKELQSAIDTGNASHFNRHFAQDVLWGSPFGAVVPVKGAARYVVEHARFPAEDIAVAYVRRLSMQPSEPPSPGRPGAFDELALLVLVRRDGEWWLAAAQHVPDRRDVYVNQ